MFCYSESCNGCHDECWNVRNLKEYPLRFYNFIQEEDIIMSREVLCLVTSWDEPPYFIVMKRTFGGMVNASDMKLLDNTKILKWAYLPGK